MASAQRVDHQLGRWVDGATQWWLGWAIPPAERAIEESGWKADEASAYCARCGATVGAGEVDDRGCAACRGSRLTYDRCVRLGAYADPLAQWIPAIKYHQWSEMGVLLGRILGERVRDANALELERAVVVPMPMPWQRRLYRSIDHAALIAQGAADALRAPLAPVLIKRNGQPQVGLAFGERRSNLRGRFRIRPRLGGWPLDGCDLVLVDDVCTTGATLREAAKLLRTLNPRRIVAAVLATADDSSRRARRATVRIEVMAQEPALREIT